MNLYSPIYPPGVEPWEPGLYLTTPWEDWHYVGLLRWDGENWFDASGKRDHTHMIGVYGQNRYWRGLAFDPAVRSGS